jgi:hypothetical protein
MFEEIVGSSKPMRRVVKQVENVAAVRFNPSFWAKPERAKS